jgi:rhomboid protease GluP
MSEGRSLVPEGRSPVSEARSQPWVLYALIAANVAMFGVELAAGASPVAPSARQMIELGASYPPLTLEGEWWRLGSSMFLHFGILHLAMNMLCLYQARAVEPLFGRLGFLVIYLVAGLGGGIASLIASTGNVVTAGASGAVFGVYGAFGAKLVLHRSQFAPDSWHRTVRRLGTFLGLNLVVGLSASGISLSAHIGGLIAGVGLGAALLAGAGAAQARTPRALLLAALGLALTAAGVMALKPDASMVSVFQHFDAVEKSATVQADAAFTRYKAGQISEAEFVGVIDRDMITPYQQLRRELLATSDVPVRLRSLLARAQELVDARLADGQALRAVATERDPAKQAALLDAYQRANDEVVLRVEAFTIEVQHLKK